MGLVNTTEKVEKAVLAKKTKILDKINISLFICLTGSLVLNTVSANNKFANVDDTRYEKTIFGLPVVADLGIDKTVDVAIDESFDDEQKEYIATAIKELDIDLTGVSYNILLDSDQKSKRCINIIKKDYKKDNSYELAQTFLKYNICYGKVIYPVNIEVYTKSIEEGFVEYDNYKDYFTAIIKHEMLHTLGFEDVYDKEYFNKTIMYGRFSFANELFDLSQEDVNMVNSVYKPKGHKIVNVQTREPVYVAPIPDEEEQTSL